MFAEYILAVVLTVYMHFHGVDYCNLKLNFFRFDTSFFSCVGQRDKSVSFACYVHYCAIVNINML